MMRTAVTAMASPISAPRSPGVRDRSNPGYEEQNTVKTQAEIMNAASSAASKQYRGPVVFEG